MINNIATPTVNNHGKAFPFNDNPTHFVGPAFVDGKLYRMSIWLNTAMNGRPYLRTVFEEVYNETPNP